MLKFYKISGDSMLPEYRHNDYVLVFRGWRPSYKLNDVVAINHPVLGRIIKRISHVTSAQTFHVSGDNPNSTSSTVIGEITPDQLLGKVIWHIK